MTDQEHDVEDLIAALRDDLPSREDERRARARLATAGVVVGSVATLAELGSAAASTSFATGNTAAATSAAAMGSGAAVGSAAAAGSLSVAAGSAAQAGGLAAQAGGLAAQAEGFALVFAKVAALGGGTKAALVTALAVGAGYPAVTSLLPPSETAAVSAAALPHGGRAREQRSVRAPAGQPVPQRQPVLGQSSGREPNLARVAESGRVG
ncbi:MAG TPA: hypothetical protein VFU02_07020, partial [Polyangiaceae bacterium]|nr:hypothetical protein [Polyangiaceae bacterium]